MANKTLLVAQREYLENVRTKTFWLGILAVPVLIIISLGAGWVLNKLKEVKTYAVIDYSEPSIGRRVEMNARQGDLRAFQKAMAVAGKAFTAVPRGELPDNEDTDKLYQAMLEMPATDMQALMEAGKGFDTAKKYERKSLSELELDHLEPAELETALGKLVEEEKLFAFFTLGKNPTMDLEGFNYVSNNLTDHDLRQWYADAATRVVQSLRIRDAKIPRNVAERLQEKVEFREKRIDEETGATADVKSSEKLNKYAPVAFVYLLWIAVFSIAQMLLTNTVEEKSIRIMEVLLSSVSPNQLMSGKIWGIAATGLTMVLSWVGFALLGVWLAPMIISGFDFPLMAVVGDPRYLISFVAYFMAGYLLYAAVLVAIGSVCNTLKEAQNLMQPVIIMLIVPLVAMIPIVQEPNGMVAKVMSYIPLFTPFTMMNRAGGPPETYEYVITGILLLATVIFAFKAAGKIFRVGVLMTGKPPKLREIFGWLRQS
jgi:ABC-2 type transport system permease protein